MVGDVAIYVWLYDDSCGKSNVIQSRLQKCVSLFSMKVEYIFVTKIDKELLLIHKFSKHHGETESTRSV